MGDWSKKGMRVRQAEEEEEKRPASRGLESGLKREGEFGSDAVTVTVPEPSLNGADGSLAYQRKVAREQQQPANAIGTLT